MLKKQLPFIGKKLNEKNMTFLIVNSFGKIYAKDFKFIENRPNKKRYAKFQCLTKLFTKPRK